jgi:hypothetical protein
MIQLIETVLLFSDRDRQLQEYREYMSANFKNMFMILRSEELGLLQYRCLIQKQRHDIQDMLI